MSFVVITSIVFLFNAIFRLIIIREPLFPLWPPSTALFARIKGLFTSGNFGLTFRARLYMIFRSFQALASQGIYSLLFTIDDILVSGYRMCELINPVFIVGGFRTGSTSLHRVMALDEERFVSPRFTELAMPFLTLHYFLDFIEWFDGVAGTQLTKSIELSLQKAAGPDVMARHPMALKVAEECDVLFATSHWCGYYAITLCPIASAWPSFGSIADFSAREKTHVLALYKSAMKKVLYRRGRGRALLSKSHLIDCMDIFASAFPGAKFINIVRHPRDVIPSWIALAQPAASMLVGWRLPLKSAVDAHLSFWDIFLAKERTFFLKDGGRQEPGSKHPRIIMQFRPFVKDQLRTMASLYAGWGLPFNETPFAKRLEAEQSATKAYKSVHEYTNPTLDELGLMDEKLCERYNSYLLAMGIESKASK